MTSAFAAVFVALYVGHVVGDHWVQTHRQACSKGAPGAAGRITCALHVMSLTGTKMFVLGAVMWTVGLQVSPVALAVGLTVDAASHYLVDRRVPLAVMAERVGKGDFYRLGDPMAAPTGTGAYSLDQSWHAAWLFIASLIIAGGI